MQLQTSASKFFKKSISCLVMVIIFLFGSVGTAHAATYYLDSVGGNDTNPGTSAQFSWKTLDHLRTTALQPNDTVYFKTNSSWDTGLVGGTLSNQLGLELKTSGTPAQPITLTSYGAGTPPVFFNTYSASPYVRAITVSGSYYIIENIHVQKAHEMGITLTATASNNILRNIEAYQNGIGVGIVGNNNTLTKSHLHDGVMMVNTQSPNSDDAGAIGILLGGSNNTITNNLIENNLQKSYDFGTDGGAIEFFSQGTAASNNVITYNTMRNNNGAVELGGENTPVVANNIFAYNILENNGGLAVIHLSDGFGANVSNLQFFNNTIYENISEWTGTNEALRAHSSMIWFDSTPASSVLVLKNNIFSVSGFDRFASNNTFTHDYNLYALSSGMSAPTLSAHELAQNPLFLTVGSSKNYHLQSSSPAIDKGTLLNYLQDFDGNSVPQGSAPDLGVFEYNSNAASPAPTVSPSPSPSVSPSPSPSVCPGDFNKDLKVNLLDYSILINSFFHASAYIPEADFNKDNKINLIDYATFLPYLGKTCN